MILMKNKALFALIAALLCGCLLLAACKGGQEQETSSTADTTAPAESVTDPVEDSSDPAQTEQGTQNGGEESGTQGDGATSDEQTTSPETEPVPDTVTYTVSVIGSDGNPRQGALVRIFKGEEQVTMAVTAADGNATAELPADTYAVVIDNVLGENYSKEGCTLTPDSTSLTVNLYGIPAPGEEIYAYSASADDYISYMANKLSEGSYGISVNADDMTYYLFTASRGGTFSISTDAELPVSIGYFGSTSYVLTESVATEENNAITVDVYDDMVFNYAFVIGVRSEEATLTECVLRIEYLSERETTENDVPWNDLMPTEVLTQYTMGAGTPTNFAVDSAEIALVYSENDGCYHVGSEDGPVVLINLGNDSLYMDALTTVCGNMRLGVYVYGEDGKLLSKDSYNELIWAYDAVSDGGYYPLDDTLIDMLKTVGDYMGWYDPASPMYLFEGVALEPANAFLFACVYLK